MQEPDKLFDAKSQTVNQLFGSSEIGFYIPVYQRQYTWECGTSRKKQAIDKLFDDIFYGMKTLLKNSNSYTFLGAIILVKDDGFYKMVKPLHNKYEMPKNVYHIIDGQQRISTILLILISLQKTIKEYKNLIEGKSELEGLFQIMDQIFSFVDDTIHASIKKSRCPKMIRSIADSWDKDKEKAIYTSPISYYSSDYNQYDGKGIFATDSNKELKTVQNAIVGIDKLIKSITDSTESNNLDDDITQPSLKEMFSSELYTKFLKNEYDILIDIYEKTQTETKINGVQRKKLQSMLKIFVFTKYLLNRVALTTVISDDDSYAFNIFEALNTTGQPLTAFETFKPLALENITSLNEDDEQEVKLVNSIEEHLSNISKKNDNDSKTNATVMMIMMFGFTETGEKVTRKLVDQRYYLRKSFENLTDYANSLSQSQDISEEEALDFARKQKITYLENMCDTAEFISTVWNTDNFSNIALIDYETNMALTFLKQAKNMLSNPILIRFLKLSQTFGVEYFSEAVKATAAFFAMWRSVRPNIDKVNTCFHNIMRNNIASDDEKSFIARYKVDSNGQFITSNLEQAIIDNNEDLAKLALQDLKANYRYILSHGINYSKKDDSKDLKYYIDERERYQHLMLTIDSNAPKTKTTIKYLLMVADGNQDMLNADIWKNSEFSDFHQIAPKNPTKKSDWDDIFEGDAKSIDHLGNLVLYQSTINNTMEKKGWKFKQEVFKLYSSTNNEDIYALEDKIHIKSDTLKELKSICTVKTFNSPLFQEINWGKEQINNRTKHLAYAIWEKLAKEYLSFDK